MSQQPTGKVIVLQPSDASAKITDVVEAIISDIMETGEASVVGLNDSMFLACSALNMSTEIAKVYVDDIDIASIEVPTLGKVSAVSAHLSQKQAGDYSALAEKEDKTLTDLTEQTISVSRAATIERLITISLLRLAKFDELKIVAAGGSINDAIALALKLANGQISKDPVGIKLFHLYSIIMRNDPTKSIAAVSIYLQKEVTTRYTKRQSELLKKLESGTKTEKSSV
jgi:DNA-binding protein